MAYETELWPLVKARWYGTKRTTRPDWIVIHTMQFFERITAAEDIAHDFAVRPASNKASAHICVDSDSIIQCVPDSYKPYAAGATANARGMHIELAGYAEQTPAQWRDKYSTAMLAVAADAAAQYALKYAIPVRHLTLAQILASERGVVGHDQMSAAFKQSTHTDPGPNFPWPRFIAYMQASFAERG